MNAGSHIRRTTNQISVLVSSDKLRAWVELPALAAPGFVAPSRPEFIEALHAAKVAITPIVEKRLDEYITLLAAFLNPEAEGRPEIPERYLVAEGTPPVEAINATFTPAEIFSRPAIAESEDDPVDYYARNSILTIEAGTVVGRITPPKDGRDGTNVFGEPVRPRRRNGRELRLGNGIGTGANDPLAVIAEVPGRFEQDGERLSMCELLDISSDVDFKSGNVDSVIDVHVHRGIKPKFVVKSAKSITVEKDVDAARLEAGGDIVVRGGIFGQEKGLPIRAGGTLTASICDGTDIRTGGDVFVSKEIINSKVYAGGRLMMEQGVILGGEIHARNGISVKFAGSDLGVKTRISVGLDGAVIHAAQGLADRVQELQGHAGRVRETLQPLLNNVRRLTASQREQATELIAKKHEYEKAAEQVSTRREKMLADASPDGPVGIDISGAVYPGVMVVFGLRQARIPAVTKGPLRIEERQVNGASQIVVVHQSNGAVQALRSTSVNVRRFQSGPDSDAEG